MASITLGGNPVNTAGDLPQVGTKAPSFKLTGTDLKEFTQDDFSGKKILLNIFPSIDTGVCSTSARKFNEAAAGMENAVMINVSKDLPFAMKRYCASEGLEAIQNGSSFRSNDFADQYHVEMIDGGMHGLYSRAVVVIDEEGNVAYTEQVPEIGQEPNYDAALAALS